jgi:tripartite-type tricarboxylate transporter receptor subunit TctC
MVTNTHAVNAALFPDLRWDPAKDFISAGQFAKTVPYLVVPASAKSRTLSEFVAAAKAQPGKLNYGHAGIGSPPHLGFELFKRVAGLDIQAIPYKGNPQVLAELSSGRIDAALLSGVSIAGPAKGGQIKPLVIMDARRSRAFPDVPSISEAGYPKSQSASWFGVVLAAKTPPAVVQRISEEIEKAANAPDMPHRLEKVGAELAHLGHAAFDDFIRSEITTWKRIVKEANVKRD